MNLKKIRVLMVLLGILFLLTSGLILASGSVLAQSTDSGSDDSEQSESESTEEEQFDPFESGVIHEFPNGAELRYVEFEDGVATAYIYIENIRVNERVKIGSAVASSGVVPSTSVTLQEGKNVVSVQLQDESLEGVSIETGGETYAYLGEDNRLTLAQDVPRPWFLTVLGMILVFMFVVAFNQFRKRKSGGVKNVIKT